MSTFNDFSQLKKFKPVPPKTVPVAPPPEPEDRALAGAASSTDYFSSLLGPSAPQKTPAAKKPNRATVVTPATINRVREELAEDARAAERAAFAAREAELLEEIEIQKAATESIAAELAALRQELESYRVDCELLEADKATLEREKSQLAEQLDAERDKPATVVPDLDALAEKDREINSLKSLLAEAQRDVRLHDSLLDAPIPFSEKFEGEVREHVVEALADARKTAEAGGRERRERILEAVLGANAATGELDRRRELVKQILKDADSKLDNAALAELEKLGFRHVSGKNHHKLDWAGIRFPLAKTPSDYRACLNSAAEICNRVF